MDDIINIKTFIDFKLGKKPADAIVIRIVSGATTDILKKNGDRVITQEGEDTTVDFFVGEKIQPDSWRALGGKIVSWLAACTIKSVWLDPGKADIGELLEGLMLGSFRFDQYKTEPELGKVSLTIDAPEQLFTEKQILCDAVNMARNWAHEPASVINPWTLSDRVEVFAKTFGLRCTILNDDELREMGAGAIVGVGQASKTPSRMIILEYLGTKKDVKPVVLVGKAITFDSGGYSIKPHDSMVTMKYDKCGAMAVLGILRTAALLKLETPLVGIICAAENMLSQFSYRPDDILTSLSGKTIEVISTDAEGRLVLADGLTYAQKHFNPRCIVDYATLTGGCVVALANVRAGVISNNDALFDALYDSGEKTWERVWRLPTDDDYAEMLKSTDADIKNSGGRWGSPVTGGMFLKAFVDDQIPWAHIDIAGVADSDKPSAYSVPGATGFGIRLTIDWLKSL